MNNSNDYKSAGFWIRLLATWIDYVLVYAALKLFFYALVYSSAYIYFPFEFTFVIVAVFYSVLFLSIKGQTVGKYLLGITVLTNKGGRLPLHKSVLRESVYKIFSATPLLLGFFWIGFSKKKKGWHDYLCQSKVVQQAANKRFYFAWRLIALGSFIFFSANYIRNFAGVILDAGKIALSPESVQLPFMKRDPSTVTDISRLTDTSFIQWLNKNVQSPETYALQAANTHQVVLFGEAHANGDILGFFNKMIAPLYYKSGVRVIAMEVIPSSMNKNLERLVNAKKYDSSLAITIARSNCWKSWGYKEYWDVLETVWKLNQGLPTGQQRMRIVGIDDEWVMPNFSLLNISEDSKGKTPFWEKFRLVSVIKDLPKIIYRDEIMSRNIEKEIISKNQKGVVLIGFAHSVVRFAYPIIKDKKIMAVKPRLGVLLSQKYKDKIFQIEFYHRLDDTDDNRIRANSVDSFLDSIMKKRNNLPVGFTITGSPFETIRDSCSFYFNKYPSICYGDIAEGFIFLKPFTETTKCTWTPGYISYEMFMKYKPMYALMLKKKFNNARQLNELFSRESALY